jgi:plastocyanin
MPRMDTFLADTVHKCLRGFVLAGLVLIAVTAAAQARATTEPAQTDYDKIRITDHAIIMPVTKVSVGTLVVFVVKNVSSHPRSVVVGSYKSKTLAPGTQVEFELSFPVPWTFNVRSSGKHVPTLTAKFVCTF